MIFNSLKFIIFFSIVFFLYYFPFKEKTRSQNWLLLIASYVFYGIAEWRMIPLLFTATVIFYFLGLAVHSPASGRRSSMITWFGVMTGIGFLLYFKYLNFFIESFAGLFNSFGLRVNWNTFNIIMPLGISFFTFKLISYIIEIHRCKIEPTKNFVEFAAYISFFPTIMSGPIDRPNSFLPQLGIKRPFNYDLAVDGCRQILWGIFKKTIIADTIADYVNSVWMNIPDQRGSTLLVTAFLYSIQMYTDFSGYSDMAIGVAKILGFRIMRNFNYPFFARNIAEFWRSWHMSLTSWLTDYVFMPLNVKFRNLGNWGIAISIIITFVLIGLWHGANWTFVFFGLYHGMLYCTLIVSGKFFKKEKLNINILGLPSLTDFLKMAWIFFLVSLGLIIFRADNIKQAVEYFGGIFGTSSLITKPYGLGMLIPVLCVTAVMFIVEWYQRNEEYGLVLRKRGVLKYKAITALIYWALIICILIKGGEAQEFIYFKF